MIIIVELLHTNLENNLEEKLFEIILVNDGSKDDSDTVCTNLAIIYPDTIKYFELAKNFSEHNAVIAGLNYCSGKFAPLLNT